MRIIAVVSSAVFLAVGIAGCGGGGGGAASTLSPAVLTVEEAMQHGTWTILVYLDADNDLEDAGVHNFNQMEMIGSTRDVRVIVQMDRQTGTDSYNEKWTDTRRYLILRDRDPRVMHSIRLDETPLGELNMADWRTLKDFVEWGVAQFPADYYCLVIWDHGTGWDIRAQDTAPEYKYVVVDSTDGSDQMNITEIPLALANATMDVVAFDACYMQQIELAYELRNCARYLVGSAAAEPSPGYNYSRVLSGLSGSTTPEQLCAGLVDAFALEYPPPQECVTLSAVDLSKIGDAANAASGFAQVLISNSKLYADALESARASSIDYSSITSGTERYSLDLMDYAGLCAGALGARATGAYSALANAVDDCVIAEVHNPDISTSCGMGVYMPPQAEYDVRYRLLALSTDTLWDDWIENQPR